MPHLWEQFQPLDRVQNLLNREPRGLWTVLRYPCSERVDTLGQIVKAARDEAEIGWRLMYSTDYHAGLPKNAALLFANARTSKRYQPCTLWEFCKMLGPSLGSIPKINKVEPATLPSMRTTYGR